jgi:hypothetical protein
MEAVLRKPVRAHLWITSQNQITGNFGSIRPLRVALRISSLVSATAAVDAKSEQVMPRGSRHGQPVT